MSSHWHDQFKGMPSRRALIALQAAIAEARKGSSKALEALGTCIINWPKHRATVFPTFLVHLDAANFDSVNSHSSDTTMRVFYSLSGIAQTCAHWRNTNDDNDISSDQPVYTLVFKNKDLIFRWIVFFFDRFIANPAALEGLPIRMFDIVQMLQETLGLYFRLAKQRVDILASSEVRRVFVGLFHFTGMMKREEMVNAPDRDVHAYGIHPAVTASRVLVGLCACLSQFGSNLGPDVAIPVLTQYAGGEAALAVCALKYVRALTAYAQESNEGDPEEKYKNGVFLGYGMSHLGTFLQVFSQRDRTIREYLFSRGSLGAVTDALSALVPLVLGETAGGPVLSLNVSSRRQYLDSAFNYLAYSLSYADDGEAAVSEVVSHGLIETILRSALFTTERTQTTARMMFPDFILIHLIPSYFFYHKVLVQVAAALQRIDAAKLDVSEERDPNLAQIWELAKAQANRFILVRKLVLLAPRPTKKYTCCHVDCTVPRSSKRKFRQCSGCSIATYCSKACQRIDWVNTHRHACRLLRSSTGAPAAGSDTIRRNLPLIASLEQFELDLAEEEIRESFASAKQKYPTQVAELVAEIDTTMFPYELAVRPLSGSSEPYMKDPSWRFIISALQSAQPADRPSLTLIKVRQGGETQVLFSPSKTLRFLYNWEAWEGKLG